MMRMRPGWIIRFPVVPALLGWTALASAQFLPGSAEPSPTEEPAPTESPYLAVVHTSEEAAALLARADEGLARQDWKLAVDALQRIIELSGEHILGGEAGLYESARRHAQRRLARMPAEALDVYRLIHDGEADALLVQARRDHDLVLCRAIVERFLLAGSGDEAALTLAVWLMDEGRFSEAAGVLDLFQEILSGSTVPDWEWRGRLAVCRAALGQPERAREVLAAAATRPVAPGAAEDVARWLSRVEGFVGDVAFPDSPAATPAWTMTGGGSDRRGLMPGVEPGFPPDSPWDIPLDAGGSREQLDSLAAFARQERLLPTGAMVTDGERVVLRAGHRLVAVDGLTFEPVWESEPPAAELLSVVQGQQQVVIGPGGAVMPPAGRPGMPPGGDFGSLPAFLRNYRDHLGARICLAFGLALTVEWPGGVPEPPVLWEDDGRPTMRRGRFRNESDTPNRLTAYDLQTGRRVWSSDESVGEGDLIGVQFLAEPMPWGNKLLVPCRVGTDLYIVVLAPADGRMERHVYLCGTGGLPLDPLEPLSPCMADGVIYQPTGRGLLAALDAADLSIRWIARYDQAAGKISGRCWQAVPPMATADLVLLAPQDADALLGFERSTGQIRWQVDRGEFLYVLGADDRLVWLAGETVQAIELATGKIIWKEASGEPTGRGAIAGDRLLLPTTRGLLALDAETGRLLGRTELPGEDGMGLGNLFVRDRMLYSLEPDRLRRFPDLGAGYAEALAAWEASPGDQAAGLRLAWLELLRDEPGRALAVLRAMPAEPGQAQRAVHAGHLRVRACLAQSASGQVAPTDALSLLQEAKQAARRPGDAIDVALALGDFHRQQGRGLDAGEVFYQLVWGMEGDEVVDESGAHACRVRGLAARRLAEVLAGLSEPDRVRFHESARARMAAWAAAGDDAALRRLAEADLPTDLAAQSAVMLGRWQLLRGEHEPAEAHLRQAWREGRSATLRAESAAWLARLYLEPGLLYQPLSAKKYLDVLSGSLAEQQVSGRVVEQPSADLLPALDWPGAGNPIRAGDAAVVLSQQLNSELAAAQARLLEAPVLGPARSAELTPMPAWRPIVLRESAPEPLIGTMLGLVVDRVEARRVSDLELRWEAELRLLSELSVTPDQNQDAQLRQRRALAAMNSRASRARAVAEGQTLLVNSDLGLHAIGLLTGRRLWSRPFEPPALPGEEASGSDAWVWVQEGRVVSVDARGRLEAARLEAGHRPLWRRTDAGAGWRWVRARGAFVVAMDSGLRQVDVFRLADGYSVGRCTFIQPPDTISVTLFDEVICGPSDARDVVAYELATPGVQRWRVSMPGELSQLFKPAPDLLGVSDRAGRLKIVDPRTGRVILETRIDACPEGVTDGWIENDVLFVGGYKRRPASGRPDYTQQVWGLAALHPGNGELIWQRADLSALTYLSAEVFQAAANVIPLVAFLPPAREEGNASPPSPGPAIAGNGAIELTLIEKKTGELLGEPRRVEFGTTIAGGLAAQLSVRDGYVDVIAGGALIRFACDADAPSLPPGARVEN